MVIAEIGTLLAGCIIEKALGASIDPVGKAVGSMIRKTKWEPTPGFIEKINGKYPSVYRICGVVTEEPVITIEGKFELSSQQRKESTKIRKRLLADGDDNDQHAILLEQPDWNDHPISLKAKTLDFAEVKALRQENSKPMVLSSCVVLVCNETKELVVQRRSEKVETYKNSLHTFGGAFIPPPNSDPERMRRTARQNPDRNRLTRTARREVDEECQLEIALRSLPPMIISQEIETGFVQLVLLGVAISEAELKNHKDSWEGSLIKIHYSQLETRLAEEAWCPSGLGQVLAWLAFGAPNAGTRPRFGKLSPKELFEKLVV